jgi:hypothetical protein
MHEFAIGEYPSEKFKFVITIKPVNNDLPFFSSSLQGLIRNERLANLVPAMGDL